MAAIYIITATVEFIYSMVQLHTLVDQSQHQVKL